MRLTWLLLLAACGSAPIDDPQPMPMNMNPPVDPGELPRPLRGACDPSMRLGGFRAEALERFSSVEGSVLDGVIPATVPKEIQREGACALFQSRHLSCPPCAAGETCGADNTCIPYPSQEDLGTVTIDGLAQPVEMTPRMPGFRYFDTSLPNPPYEHGAKIHLQTSGGKFGALDLWGVGPEALVLPAEFVLRVSKTEPLAVNWTPAAAGALSRVILSINVDQHGASPLELVCDFDDSGSGEVPAVLVQEFLDAGVSGYPNGKLVRRTADHQEVSGGCIDLVIADIEKATVRVPDHLPCSASDPCPQGLTCELATNTCR